MEQPEEQGAEQAQEGSGEDHRQGQPGYDLDEQRAIEDLENERDSDEG